MRVTITQKDETIIIDTSYRDIGSVDYNNEYHPWKDKKWIKFCEDHNFNRYDTHGKVYNLYLEMCLEGML